jgi:hypothetical protein
MSLLLIFHHPCTYLCVSLCMPALRLAHSHGCSCCCSAFRRPYSARVCNRFVECYPCRVPWVPTDVNRKVAGASGLASGCSPASGQWLLASLIGNVRCMPSGLPPVGHDVILPSSRELTANMLNADPAIFNTIHSRSARLPLVVRSSAATPASTWKAGPTRLKEPT